VCFPAKEGRTAPGSDGRWSKADPRPGYENWEALLKGDEPVLVTGTVQINQRDEEQPLGELIAEEIQLLKEARDKRVKRLELRIAAERITEGRWNRLAELARQCQGPTQLAVFVLLPGEAEVAIATPLRVQLSDELLASLNELFGAQVCELG